MSTATIDAPDVSVSIEMQTDGAGLRFGIEPNAKWIHIYTVLDHEIGINHIEHVFTEAGADLNVYSVNMFEAEEVISKMRMVIACYDAIKAQNAKDDI